MKPEELYENMKQLAERLEITVSEENLKISGIKVKSGFCMVRGNKLFIIDKRLKTHKKVDVLAEFLSSMPHEEIYIVPAVRDLLGRYSKIAMKKSKTGLEGESLPSDEASYSDDNN
jgi:hypothetical protein